MEQIFPVGGTLLILAAHIAGQLRRLDGGSWAVVASWSIVLELRGIGAAPPAHA